MYISKAASITALLENAGGSLPCLASELNHTSLEILAFLMKTIFKKKKKTKTSAWPAETPGQSLMPASDDTCLMKVWGPCLSGRESCVPHLYEKEGQNFCFWHFILESVLSEEEKKKSSNVESRQKRWGWNLEAIHPARAAAALRRWGSPYTA